MFSWFATPHLRGRVALIAGALSVTLWASGCGASSHAETGPFYLALGDSLSVGIQPDAQGAQLETDAGYVNDVYARLKARMPQLKLVKMGCPGDATTQVLTGQGNTAAAKAYHCDRSGGSQLKAALAFIAAHRQQVKVISIDIGANDLNACISGTTVAKGTAYIASCITSMEGMLAANLPKIFGPLKAAAAPGTTLVAGTIYNPFLVGLLGTTTTLKTIAVDSVGVVDKVNAEITTAATQAGLKVADLSTVFQTDDTAEVKVPQVATKVPQSLVRLCAYTYLCTAKPQGPNIHPNTAGYKAIAKAYEQQLGNP